MRSDKHEAIFGGLARSFQRFFSLLSHLKLVELENPLFEESYAVYSTDPLEARYILSVTMMERILHLKQRYGKGIQLTFKDSRVLIAIPHRGDFLDRSFNLENIKNSVKSMVNEIYYLLDILYQLKINENIWNKEKRGESA